MRGAQKAQPFGHPLDGRVRRLVHEQTCFVELLRASVPQAALWAGRSAHIDEDHQCIDAELESERG